jgi:16S rRNA processing protein RimM
MRASRDLDWNAMALVGRIARAHGIRGEVLVNPETDFVSERFRPGSVLYVSRSGLLGAVQIEAARIHLGRPLLKLAGVTTMSEAEALAGLELRIPLDALRRLPEGWYYAHDLCGCRVETADGVRVGRVEGVQGLTGTSCLVVATDSGSEILVPLAEEICVTIDPGAGFIVIRPPEGLLELNEPQRRRRRS